MRLFKSEPPMTRCFVVVYLNKKPADGGLHGLRLQGRQPCGETDKNQANQRVSDLRQFLFSTNILCDKGARDNQEAQVAEAHHFKRDRQNKE